jgi:hypothetical protein
MLGGLACIGTAWFWFVEHFSVLDASARRLLIFLEIFYAGAAFYTLGGGFEELVENALERFARSCGSSLARTASRVRRHTSDHDAARDPAAGSAGGRRPLRRGRLTVWGRRDSLTTP